MSCSVLGLMAPRFPENLGLLCSRCLPQGSSQGLVPNSSGSFGRKLLHHGRHPLHQGPVPFLSSLLASRRRQQQQGGPLPLVLPQPRREKMTKTVMSILDLPQGPIANQPGEADLCQHEVVPAGRQSMGPKYPAVLQQARENMDRLGNCVLLTRVGGFYELYFEHAQKYGPLLNLKVASKKTNVGPILMVHPATVLGLIKHVSRKLISHRLVFPTSNWIVSSRYWFKT